MSVWWDAPLGDELLARLEDFEGLPTGGSFFLRPLNKRGERVNVTNGEHSSLCLSNVFTPAKAVLFT